MKVVTNKAEIERIFNLIISQYQNSDANSKPMLETDLMKLIRVTTKNPLFATFKAQHLLKSNEGDSSSEYREKAKKGFAKINTDFIDELPFNIELSRSNTELLIQKPNKLPKIDSDTFHHAINEFSRHLDSEEYGLFDSIVNGSGLIITKGKNNGAHFKIYSLDRNFIEITQRNYSYLSYGTFCHEFGHAIPTSYDYQRDYQEIENSRDTYLTETLSILYEMIGASILDNSNPHAANVLMKWCLHSNQQFALDFVKRSKSFEQRKLNQNEDSGFLTFLTSVVKRYLRYTYGTAIAAILLEEKERDELAYRQKVGILKRNIGYKGDFEVLSDVEITKDTLLKQEACKRLIRKTNIVA